MVKNTTEKTPFIKSLLPKDRWSLLCQTVRVHEYFLKVSRCERELKYLFEGLRQVNLRGLISRFNNLKCHLNFTIKFCITTLLVFFLTTILPSFLKVFMAYVKHVTITSLFFILFRRDTNLNKHYYVDIKIQIIGSEMKI